MTWRIRARGTGQSRHASAGKQAANIRVGGLWSAQTLMNQGSYGEVGINAYLIGHML